MKNPNNWYRPLLGTTLLSVLVISGCTGDSGVSGGLNGFVGNNSSGSQNNGSTGGGGGGNTTSAAPFLEVLNQTSIAEFSINQSTGALTPVNFNTTGTNGVQNTIQLSNTPQTIGFFTNTASNTTDLYVGTDQNIQAFTVDNTTGNLTAIQENGTNFLQTTGASVTSINTIFITATNATTHASTSAAVLYASLQNNQVQAFTINADGSLAPLNFNNSTNSIATGINQPIQMVTTANESGGALPFLYVLNQAGGTGNIAAFTITDGVTEPNSTLGGLQVLGTPNTISGNGIGVPTALGEFVAPNLGLIVASQNNSLSLFSVQPTGTGTAGTLVAAGNSVGANVSTPTGLIAVGPVVLVTSQQGGLASFSITSPSNSLNNLTLTPTNSGQNNTTTGVNLPASVTAINTGVSDFIYVSNTQGTGTGSIGQFDLASTLNPQPILVTNGTNTQNSGILSPVLNPVNMLVITGQ